MNPSTFPSNRPWRVLVVGQTPPPFHGQAIMMERLVQSHMARVDKFHVRMGFSQSMDQVGRFQWRKLLHLMAVIGRIIHGRFVHRADAIYYPPAGPHRIPMYRDIVLLICTRWLFRATFFHMQASGLSELYSRLHPLEKWFFRRAYLRPEAVIRLSDQIASDAATLQARQEFIIPNCADDEWSTFGKELAAREAKPDRSLAILYVGTVCETKGILDLLAACQGLRARGGDFRLHVVGSFQPATFLRVVEQRITDHQLEERVILHGQLTGPEKFRAFASADIFCFPTYYESEAFPCVVVEALSFGLPVVATRWRGVPSIVEHQKSGFLVEIHDITRLTDHLEILAHNRELRITMGRCARESFLARFTTVRHLTMMEEMFCATLKVASQRPTAVQTATE